MAKKEKMVTRTFKTTQFNIVGIINMTIEERQSDLVVGEMTETECKAYAERMFSDGFMVAGVKDIVYGEKLYGMTESDFLRNAVELPPRTGASKEDE